MLGALRPGHWGCHVESTIGSSCPSEGPTRISETPVDEVRPSLRILPSMGSCVNPGGKAVDHREANPITAVL